MLLLCDWLKTVIKKTKHSSVRANGIKNSSVYISYTIRLFCCPPLHQTAEQALTFEVGEDFKKMEGQQKDDGHRNAEMCPRVTDPAYWGQCCHCHAANLCINDLYDGTEHSLSKFVDRVADMPDGRATPHRDLVWIKNQRGHLRSSKRWNAKSCTWGGMTLCTRTCHGLRGWEAALQWRARSPGGRQADQKPAMQPQSKEGLQNPGLH